VARQKGIGPCLHDGPGTLYNASVLLHHRRREIIDAREIGFLLFDRLARGVRLSAAGRLFLNDARRILQDVEEAKRRAERTALGKAGTLRLGGLTRIGGIAECPMTT
jgi:hypothetical protein